MADLEALELNKLNKEIELELISRIGLSPIKDSYLFSKLWDETCYKLLGFSDPYKENFINTFMILHHNYIRNQYKFK